jgi:hypothetical protein
MEGVMHIHLEIGFLEKACYVLLYREFGYPRDVYHSCPIFPLYVVRE